MGSWSYKVFNPPLQSLADLLLDSHSNNHNYDTNNNNDSNNLIVFGLIARIGKAFSKAQSHPRRSSPAARAREEAIVYQGRLRCRFKRSQKGKGTASIQTCAQRVGAQASEIIIGGFYLLSPPVLEWGADLENLHISCRDALALVAMAPGYFECGRRNTLAPNF